ncbi:hypothetical protein CRG98_033717, partial [Punica granatum]
MERKQGFFSALKDEVVRGLSPGRSRSRTKSPARSSSPMSGLLRRSNRGRHNPKLDPQMVSRSGVLMRPPAEALSPLKEGPDPEEADGGDSRGEGRWGHWMKGQKLSRTPSVSSSSSASSSSYSKRSDLRLLLGVLGAPLAPVHVTSGDPLPHLSIKNTPI